MKCTHYAWLILATLSFAPACEGEKSKDDSSDESDEDDKKKKKKKKGKKEKKEEKKDEAVLPRMATYVNPKEDEYEDIYDRWTAKQPVETLVWDVFQRLKMDVKLADYTPANVKVDDVKKGIAVYMERDWKKVAGARPHGNWNFIRGLTDAERDRLAQEILDHAQKNGLFKEL